MEIQKPVARPIAKPASGLIIPPQKGHLGISLLPKQGRLTNRVFRGTTLKKALESPVSLPAELAMGLILKASNNPKAVMRGLYQRVEQELESLSENPEASCIEVASAEAPLNPLTPTNAQ